MRVAVFEPLAAGVEPPRPATDGSRGRDLRAWLRRREITVYRPDNASFVTHPDSADAIVLMPGERALIPLGFKCQLPPGHWAEVVSRSGYALKLDLVVNNAPGIVDEDYGGEWMVVLKNASEAPATVVHGERIAQALLKPTDRFLDRVEFQAGRVGETVRGAGGFGSTGTA